MWLVRVLFLLMVYYVYIIKPYKKIDVNQVSDKTEN